MIKSTFSASQTFVTKTMWLIPFLLLGLKFSMMSPALAQSNIILWDIQGREAGYATMNMQNDDEVILTVEIKDMLPIPGDRRMAISTVGQCDLPDFGSAGEDLYDMPAIQFYAGGNANYERVVQGIDFNSLADDSGSALIIYADSDENVAERILCGIIAAPSASLMESNGTHEKPHWGYEGENGPENWGDFPDYELCGKGQNQSPIDIANASESNLVDITFNYQPTTLKSIVNNGHTLQVNYDAGSTIQVDGITFELKQFHFHTPSEHTINSEEFDLEMHLVHESVEGLLAVVGVLIRQGSENAGFAPVWNHLPTEANQENSSSESINADALLPASRLSYRYSGSLTTPPCSEGVRWLVLTTPIEMSEGQITSFKKIINHNNRPTQPHHGREIMVDSSID